MIEVPCKLNVLEVSLKMRERSKPVLEYTGVLLVRGKPVTSVNFSITCEKQDGLEDFTSILSTHIARLVGEDQA